MLIPHTELFSVFRKGLRNGNWYRLDNWEKAFYKATMLYAKLKNRVMNPKVVSIILKIIEKLKETPYLRALKNGLEKAKAMFSFCETNGVFGWCPRLREWLKTPAYIIWLGFNSLHKL